MLFISILRIINSFANNKLVSTNKSSIIKKFSSNNNKINKNIIEVNVVSKINTKTFQLKTAKSKILVQLKKSKTDFFTFKARLTFAELGQTFIKTSILYHFDLEYQIQIETNILGYIINKVLSQLTLDNLG